MWLFWGPDPNRIRCDVHFTEAINQRMQVPSRLRVTDSFSPVDEEPLTEEVSPSLRMHIPDRISLADTPNARLRPMLLTQQREVPSVMESAQPCSRDAPYLHITSRSSSQKRKRLGHHNSKSQREKTPSDSALLAMHSPGQHRERLDPCPLPVRSAPLPLLMGTGRIYSMQNVFQTMYLLGQMLFHRLQSSLRDPMPPRLFTWINRDFQSKAAEWKEVVRALVAHLCFKLQEAGPAPESALEEAGMTEMAAMRKQLMRISSRVLVLEEQCKALQQKEILVYSVLISACLINTWLWMRR